MRSILTDQSLIELAERLKSCTDEERLAFLERMDRKETYLRVLNSFAVSLMAINNYDDLVWYVAKEVVARLGFVDCVVYDYNQERQVLVQRAAFGEKNPSGRMIANPLEIPIGKGITGTVARRRRPVVVGNLSSFPGYVADLSPALSELCVPLLYGDELLGVIDCEDPRENYFTAEHQDMLVAVASLTSSKIVECNALRQVGEKAQLLNLVREAVVVADLNGTIIECNSGAVAVYGYKREQLIGALIGDLVADQEAWSKVRALRLDSLLEKGMWQGRERVKCGDGKIITADISLTPITDENGNHIATIGVGRDITDLAKAEDALKAQNRALESKQVELERALTEGEAAKSANRAKDAFLANTSHELRTPLTGVIGMIDLLRETELTPEQNEYAVTAQNSARTLTKIIDDILDLAKMEAGKVSLNWRAFDPAKLVSSAAATLGPAARGQGLEFDVIVPEQAPVLIGDANRIRQILFNLVGNAIKFTESGFVRVSLQIEPDADLYRLVLTVEDSGSGFDEEAHRKIFGRFEQLDISSSKSTGGAGLGLSIVRELAKLMNGEITARSKVGKGSAFTCVLRLRPAESLEEQDNTKEMTIPEVQDKDLRILVAEDSFINQMLVERLLGKAGWAPDVVSNGREAFELIASGAPYDLVLMDIRMPEMDGLEATAAIRALAPPMGNIPIIALTANTMESDRQRYLNSGMNAVVAKPIDRSSLMSTIAKFARRRKAGNITGKVR